jgi:hypothetical protein
MSVLLEFRRLLNEGRILAFEKQNPGSDRSEYRPLPAALFVADHGLAVLVGAAAYLAAID